MRFIKKIKGWFSRNKKYILPISGAVLVLTGVGVGYILHNNKRMSLEEWMRIASTEELNEAHKKLRVEFNRTGTRPYGMDQISNELGVRDAKEWFEKHPPNPDPNFRWTDESRWDKD